MPDPFALPCRGIPNVDWRVWRALHGDRSPRESHGTGRMLEALIRQDARLIATELHDEGGQG